MIMYVVKAMLHRVLNYGIQIKKIIDDAINIPDEDNDWMREQLRELAVINGTLRDSDTIKYVKFIFSALSLPRFIMLISFQKGDGFLKELTFFSFCNAWKFLEVQIPIPS